MEEFYYRVRQPALGHFPGSHRSHRGEHGLEYRGHAPLRAAADARRVDMLTSVRDPFEQWHVRVFAERKAVPVMLVADLSGSMGYRGARSRLEVLADFTRSLAWSAYRAGDPFGFVGCDDRVRNDWLMPPTRNKGAGLDLAERLRRWKPQGSCVGLADAPAWLPRRRTLVFVASDFHLPLERLDGLLDAIAHHEVVPVVMWDEAEFAPPRDGLAWLQDAETGRRRPVWMRPSLRARWEAARATREAELAALFRRHRLDPLRLSGAFQANAVTAHFLR